MAWLSAHRHLALLAALLVTIVFYPPLHDDFGSPAVVNSLRTALMLVGGWVAFADRRVRAAAAALAVPPLAAAWLGPLLPVRPGPAMTVGFFLSTAAFEALVAVAVLRSAVRRTTVTGDAVAGALVGYLLVGVIFGHLYTALEEAAPGSFAGLTGPTTDHRHFRLTYFSFVTLTTVGFGDITPAADAARSLTLCEAVVGQFYTAVLIAGLIGKWLSQPPAGGGEAG